MERALTSPRPRPIDIATAAYLFAAGAALLFPGRPPGWPLLAAAHLGGILLLLRVPPFRGVLRAVGARLPRTARTIGDWYPLFVMPLLYAELATLNVAVHSGRYFDDHVIGWEQAIFGGQPSRDFAAAAPDMVLSESLHAAYLSYYLIIYIPPLLLYARGMRAAFRTTLLALMLTFYAHYVFFVYFPVQGPRYLFEAPVVEAARGPVWTFAHRLLEAGSSRGAAFPSSHVGVAFAQAFSMFRFMPRAAPAVTLLGVGLALGAVYGGFHYATDAVAGLILGLLVAWGVHRTLDAQPARGA